MQEIIKDGYKLPFIKDCPSFYAKNNASSRSHPEFVEDAIEKLLEANCIKEVDSMPYVCNPLTVAKGKKLRLVLDLRHVNARLEKQKFKYEDLKTFSKMFEKGSLRKRTVA